MASKAVWMALAGVVLVAQLAVGQEADECGEADIVSPPVPEALEAYQEDMLTFGTPEMTEEEKNTRLARKSTRQIPRTATDQSGNTLKVSDRFCALDYPEEPCSPTWDSGSDKPEGLECAGTEPVAGAECNTEYMEKYMGLPVVNDMTGALIVALSLPVTVGIVFMVLYFLWYFLRCCKLCGGRKPSKECICCANYYDAEASKGITYGTGDNEGTAEPPGYVLDGGGCPCGCQVNLLRLWFALFFVLVTAALGIGVWSNMTVDTGLSNTVDILFYNLQRLAYEVSEMLDQMNGVMSDAGIDGADLAEQQGQLSCLSQELKDLESDIQDAKELGLEVRGYFVYLTLVVPFLIGLLYGLSAFFKWKCCVGFGSLLAWLLLLFVCLSAGIHSMLSLLLADVCYEFDLHLASYHLETSDLYGTHENLAWLPEEAQGFCGEDGSLAFVEQEFELQFDAAIQSGLDGLRDVCNDEDMRGFMDCGSVQILEPDPVSGGPPFVSKVVDYTVESCGAGGDEPCSAEYYNGLLAQVPDELLITDVDLAAVQVTSLSDLPAEVLNCLAAPYTSIAKVAGVWPDTGWSDLNVCMGDSGPTNATSADDCDGPDELWIGLGVDPNLQACTENGVTIEGFCEGPAGPTAAAVQADCGVDVGGTWSTTGYAWTPMADQVLAAPYDVSTILANAEACVQAATMVHVGRLYGPAFASCSTPGDPSSCSVDTAAVENSYTAPFLVDETDALDSFSISPPDADAVKDCYIEINLDSPCVTAPCENPYFQRITFRECADPNSGCAEPGARNNSETAVTALDDATSLFAEVHQIFDEDARPKLQCKFVSEILADVFVPLCQEAYGGITFITLANYLGLVGLVISLPLGIISTKRFDKRWANDMPIDNTPGTKHRM